MRQRLSAALLLSVLPAAALDMGLVENSQMLHVIPASYQIEEALRLPGTKVLMKAGKKMGQVKQLVQQLDEQAVMIENCGMPDEKIYRSAGEIPEQSGYYSLHYRKGEMIMVHFVGAGSGAPDLITVRGMKLLQEADIIIYAGSLVNPQLLEYKKEGCAVYNSAKMTLEEVLDVMFECRRKRAR